MFSIRFNRWTIAAFAFTTLAVPGTLSAQTPDHPADERLRQAKEFGTVIPVQLVDEMVISQNLPRASQQVLEALG